MGEAKAFPWTRRVVALDRPASLDRDGWPTAQGSVKAGRSLSELRGLPVLVLRSEWGSGKSYAFWAESAALGSRVQLLNLGEGETDATRAERKLASAFRVPEGEGEWYVLLDGLDEGADDLPGLPQLIVEQIDALQTADRDRLRLRISCRTARWPMEFEDNLRARWPVGGLETVTLVPLSREDVVVAARQAGVAEADAFVDLIQLRGLVSLATNPMTLLELLENRKNGGALPETAGEAYQQACRRLCTETRRPRTPAQRSFQAAPERLLAASRRVAAAMQFGAYLVLSNPGNYEHDRVGEGLELASLEGDEPGHLGLPLPCTVAELRQLTESSLLAPVGGDYRWQFAHSSYREYLTAQFLRVHNVPTQVLRELLWVGDGPDRHIIAAHQEVAAWLSDTEPAVFEDLLAGDPVVALLSRDLPARSPSDRERLAAVLLDLLAHDDTAQPDRAALHRLDHPGLAKQLRPCLEQGADASWLVYWAATIARSCPNPVLNPALLCVAENKGFDQEVRVAALRAVTTPDGDAVARLEELARDVSAEVVAATLPHLRGGRLPLADLLSLVRDPAPNYVGTAWALHRTLPEQLTNDEIGEAAVWACQALTPAGTGSKTLALSVLVRALLLADQDEERDDLLPPVADALLEATFDPDLLDSNELKERLDALGQTLKHAERVRRLVILHLLTCGTTRQVRTLLAALPHGALLSQQDQVYWMEHWELLSLADPEISQRLVFFRAPADPDSLRRCQAARAAQHTLRDATRFWDTPTEESPPERQGRDLKVQQPEDTYSERELKAALDAVMDAHGNETRTRWINVVDHLLRTADGRHQPSGPLLTAAAESPSRPQAGSALAALLERAAHQVLREAPPVTANDFTPDGRLDFRQAPELTAMPLVDTLTATSDDHARWAGWAIALASNPTYQPDDAVALQQRLLVQCDHNAAQALEPLLTGVLAVAHPQTIRQIAHAYAPLTDQHTQGRDTLLRWATQPERTPQQWHQALSELTAAGDQNALNAIAAALQTPPDTTATPHSTERKRWLLAVETLTQSTQLPQFWPDIRPALQDPDNLDAFLEQTAQMNFMGRWPSPVAQLPEKDLADLYRLMIQRIGQHTAAHQAPLTQAATRGGDQKREMLQSLPRILATIATPAAAHELRALADAYPQVPELRRQARLTGRAAAAKAAVPLNPRQLMELATHSRLRLVRDARQLLDVVIEALKEMQQELGGYNGTVVNLWNRDKDRFQADTKCWPAWEDDLSDAIAAFLRREIGGNRAVVNGKVVVSRETEIRRPGLPGQRTDIQLDVPPSADGTRSNLRVVIECKGCWSDELGTALETQLSSYLTEPRTAGLLLVGYFDCTRWNHRKRRGTHPMRHTHTFDQVKAGQADAAGRARAGLTVSSFVLNCALPGVESDWRKVSQTEA